MSATKKSTPEKVLEPVKAAVPESPAAVETAVPKSSEPVKMIEKEMTEAPAKKTEKVVKETKVAVTKVVALGDDALKAYEDVISYGKDNFEAFMKANTVFTECFETINQELLSMMQSSFEENATVAKKVLACNNIQEVVSLQNELVTQSYSKSLEQSKKITNLTVKALEDTTKPISERINITVERFAKPLAA